MFSANLKGFKQSLMIQIRTHPIQLLPLNFNFRPIFSTFIVFFKYFHENRNHFHFDRIVFSDSC